MTSQRTILLVAGLAAVGIAAVAWWSSTAGATRVNTARESDSGTAIAWLTDYDAALAQARSSGKPIVVDFFATWCGSCKLMERTTFTDANVQSRVADFVPLKIDVDRQPRIAQLYGIEGLPTILVTDADGKPLRGAVGYLDPERFLIVLDSVPAQESRPKVEVRGEPTASLGINPWLHLQVDRPAVDVADRKGTISSGFATNRLTPAIRSS